ncbi:hypothetical protein AB0I81_17815 [Nonomuraea sp. NPDC050404]|uniref:hypothetical protein n=1 Tax=Nonomuraea sp. NPDC050404 TaxID=3155783 RepID=UPI0033F54543
MRPLKILTPLKVLIPLKVLTPLKILTPLKDFIPLRDFPFKGGLLKGRGFRGRGLAVVGRCRTR